MQTEDWYRERAGTSASLSVADKSTIEHDWQELTGDSFAAAFNPNCPNRYRDAIIIILSKMKNTDTKNNSGYELKRGVAFRFQGKMYDRRNITAEAAEWYIAQDLRHRDDFEELARPYDSYKPSEKTE